MKTNLSFVRKLFVVMLCVCLCVVPSFGPRLSEVAALTQPTLGTISQTDILPPISSTQETSGVQVKNILSVISLTVGNIYNVRFHLEVYPLLGINNTQLQFYDYNSEDESIISFTDNTDSNGELEVEYEPDLQRYAGTPFLYCGYNTTDDVALAKRAMIHTVGYGEMTEGFTISSFENYVLTNTKILMGDVNNDNVVDASDQSLLSSGISSPSSLTTYQFLAADVTMDKVLNAKDLLSFMQYVNGSKNSFWGTDGIVPLTNATNIVDGNKYKFYDKRDGYYLMAYDDSDGISVGNPSGAGVTTANFNVRGGETSTIQNLFSQKYLCLSVDVNNGFHLSYTLSETTPGAQWYIVKFNDNYYLVNQLCPDKFLSSNLELTRSLHYAKWDLQPQQITVDYFYNYGYRYRFWNGWENKNTVAKTSFQVDTAVVSQLQGYQTTIDNVLTKTFGIDVVMNTPELICSNEDLCYTPSQTELPFTQMVNAIGDAQIADQTTSHLACTHASPTLCGIGMPHHHRNGSAGLDYMVDKREENGEEDHIYLLTSGYQVCDVRPRTEDADRDGHINHEYTNYAGLASTAEDVCGVYHRDTSNENTNYVAALHEICHLLGAVGGEADTDHDQCVMSYDSDWGYITQLMKAQSAVMNRRVFCDDCYDSIVTYLNYD